MSLHKRKGIAIGKYIQVFRIAKAVFIYQPAKHCGVGGTIIAVPGEKGQSPFSYIFGYRAADYKGKILLNS